MNTSDEHLLHCIAQGDQEAFLLLYDRFAPRVFGLVVKVMGRRPEAEDVMQEVMWEAWNRAARYDPNLGSPTTWLLLMARSRAIDAIRKLRAAAGAIEERGQRQRDAQNSTPPDSSLPDVADPRLRAALDALPPDQRVVIALAFFRGLTREEIAASLSIPVGTVKTRIRLGVKRLAELNPHTDRTSS